LKDARNGATIERMKKIILLALVLVGCGEGLTVPATIKTADTGGAVDTTPRSPCCIYFESPVPAVTACWLCGPVVVCAGDDTNVSATCPDDMPTCLSDEVRAHGSGSPVYGGELLTCEAALGVIAHSDGLTK
jgi:hypothetical protein